ncbi:MAG: DUF3857 domain-containing protein [Albidovulum sp.]
MWLVRLVFVLIALPVWAGDFQRGDAPGWVELLALPEVDPALLAAARDGEFFLLSDDQIAWDGEVRLAYSRVVSQVIDRAGLERVATISRDFDPAYETLTLTGLRVIRDGMTVDYRESLEADVLRRESQLEAGIIDGTLTVHLQIPDLRVGDIVDMSFLTAREPIVAGATRAGTNWLEFSVPVGLARYVVHWPEGWPLNAAALPERVEYSQTPEAEGQRLVWRRVGHVPMRGEEMTPAEDDPDAVVRISAWADWGPLSAALTPYYAKDYPLTPEWDAKVEAIRHEGADAAAHAIAALRLVQREIRYVGLEVGAGGYFARSPATVIAQGFGDCKDKALLLRVILSRLGISSVVALADLDQGYGLAGLVPSMGAFDHMILRADVDGKAHWMDPTGSYEGGNLAAAAMPDYGYALPLAGASQSALERMAPEGGAPRMVYVHESFSFNLFGVFLWVKTEFGGELANSQRYKWATKPQVDISQDYLEYYADRYPGIEQISPSQMSDDLEENLVTIQEFYRIPPAALEAELRSDFVFAADNYGRSFPKVQIGPRQTPLLVGAPRIYRHHIEVQGAPIAFRPPEPERLSNPAFEMSFKGNAKTEGTMQLDWEFTTTNRVVAADDVAQVISQARKIGNLVWLSWDLRPDDAVPGN